MSLVLTLYVLALCACAAAITYGIVRPERPRSAETTVRPHHVAPSKPAAPTRARRLAA